MHGLGLTWSDDDTISRVFTHKVMHAEKIYASGCKAVRQYKE